MTCHSTVASSDQDGSSIQTPCPGTWTRGKHLQRQFDLTCEPPREHRDIKLYLWRCNGGCHGETHRKGEYIEVVRRRLSGSKRKDPTDRVVAIDDYTHDISRPLEDQFDRDGNWIRNVKANPPGPDRITAMREGLADVQAAREDARK